MSKRPAESKTTTSGRRRRGAVGAAIVALPIALLLTAVLGVAGLVPVLWLLPAYGAIGAVLTLAILLLR